MPSRPPHGHKRETRYAYAYEGGHPHYDGRSRGHGKKVREKDSDKDNNEESFAPGGSAARMGGMPMGAMFGGGGGARTEAKVSNAVSGVESEAVGNGKGVNEYNLGDSGSSTHLDSSAAPYEPVSGSSSMEDVSGGSAGDYGANNVDIPAVDTSPSTSSVPMDSSSPVDENVTLSDDIPSDAQPQGSDYFVRPNEADGSTVNGQTVGVTPQPMAAVQDVSNSQSEAVIDLRRLLQGLGFSKDDSELVVRVMSDGIITAAEMEQLKSIEYNGMPDYLLGDDESETVEGVVLPDVTDNTVPTIDDPAAIVPDEINNEAIDNPANINNDINTGVVIPDAAINNPGSVQTPKLRITIDKNGNIHLECINDDGNTTASIDVDNDNNIEVSTYDATSDTNSSQDSNYNVEEPSSSLREVNELPKHGVVIGEDSAQNDINEGENVLNNAVVNDDSYLADDSIEPVDESKAAKTNDRSSGSANRSEEYSSKGYYTPNDGVKNKSNAANNSDPRNNSSKSAAGDKDGISDGVPIIPVVIPPSTPTSQDSSGSNSDTSNGQNDNNVSSNTESGNTSSSPESNGDDEKTNTSNNVNNNTNVSTSTPATQNPGSFEYLSTEYFVDAEKAAKEVAEAVRDLRTKIQIADFAASQKWLGKGHQEFKNLAYTIEIQLKDISDEFWSFYEDLTDAHSSYLEADEKAATSVNAIREDK